MSSTPMGKDFCPNCHSECDTATAAVEEEVVPVPGDVSICLYCGEFLQFSDDMALVSLSDEEWQELDDNTQYVLLNARRIPNEMKEEKTNQ